MSTINDGSEIVNPKNFDEACHFMIEVGKSAHSYGSNGSRIEDYLTHLPSAIGYHGSFRSTPSEGSMAVSSLSMLKSCMYWRKIR